MPEIEVIEKIDETIKVQIPKMYKVLLHNDDKTTFDFVIAVLMRIFHKTAEDAIIITKAIHETGQGIAGAPYTREVAEEKTLETVSFARANNFPLTPTFEEL
ncbi:MAG: ATP-dependent Clp protease adaptor ClpS [Lentisphaerota bacterium]|jgi:ATP-dependent Clp protease adaptor protein ClpS